MVVLRNPGEVFLQGNTMGGVNTTAWVERLHPETLATELRSPDLPGGPFWAGGIAVHANGDLYVTYGRYVHRVNPHTLEPIASCELPRERPYNSAVILPDGCLALKDFCGGSGAHAIGDGAQGSELLILSPDDLSILARRELPEGSIARLSAYTDSEGSPVVLAVGDQHLHQIKWDATNETLTPAAAPRRYLRNQGQSFGWDAVVADGSAWFLDNGEGTSMFGPSFSGKGQATDPLHLVRIDLEHPDRDATLTEVCGLAGGIIANPPLISSSRKIAMGYDSGNGMLAAWSYSDDSTADLVPLWTRHQHHAGHMLLDEPNGLALTFDYDHDRMMDVAVVLSLESGEEVHRNDTGSPLQAVLFPAAGWADDVYTVTFSSVTRLGRN